MYIFSLDLHLQEERGRKKDGEEKTDNGEKGRLVVKNISFKMYTLSYMLHYKYMIHGRVPCLCTLYIIFF